MSEFRPQNDEAERDYIVRLLDDAGFSTWRVRYGAAGSVHLACGLTIRGRHPWDVVMLQRIGCLGGFSQYHRAEITFGTCATYAEVVETVRNAEAHVPALIAGTRTTREAVVKALDRDGFPDGVRDRVAIHEVRSGFQLALDGVRFASIEDLASVAWRTRSSKAFFPVPIADGDLVGELRGGAIVHVSGSAAFAAGYRDVHASFALETGDVIPSSVHIVPGARTEEAQVLLSAVRAYVNARRGALIESLLDVRLFDAAYQLEIARAESSRATTKAARLAAKQIEQRAFAELTLLERDGLRAPAHYNLAGAYLRPIDGARGGDAPIP
jgi:hypothetical protein